MSVSLSTPFNMRQYNLSILKPPVNKSTGSSSSKASMSYTNAAKSLDLLRQNIQISINQEIKTLISRYVDSHVKPAIENIRNNLGPESVNDDHIQNFCRQILEEAKRMYPVYNSSPSPSNNCNSAIDSNDSDYHNSQSFQTPNVSGTVKIPDASPSFGIKRESDSDSEASSLSSASKKFKKSVTKAASSTGNNENGNSSSSTPQKPKKPSGPSRKHVTQWDSSKLTSETLFIMGAKANKALGFAQTRGRLYVKHPGLFKYASDADDKEWLSKNKLMPATGGRAYIMLLEDIEKLARDNKLNATINYDDIKGFRVPDFILEKMKSYINKWKKIYAEDIQKSASSNRNRSSNANNTNANPPPVSSSAPGVLPMNNSNNRSLTPMNPQAPAPIHHPPPPPPMTQHSTPNPHNQSLNNYPMGNNPNNVMFDPNFTSSHHSINDMREYMQIEKPPPMYPGHGNHPHNAMQQIQNPATSTGYSNPAPESADSVEMALKNDWANVPDRSLLHFALQSTRNIASWEPQDSFDLIESVTNGTNLEDNSPLLHMPSDSAVGLVGSTFGSTSPECALGAVLDQAFQYTDS